MARARGFRFAAALLALGCGRAPSVPAPPTADTHEAWVPGETGALVFDGPAPKNLWMVSIDTLRRDHVDPFAADGRVRMPFLSARMAEGALLGRHQQCANWTLHSMTCTLLGRPVEEVGWVPRLDALESPAPDGLRTLAVRLGEVGYHPLVASSNGYFGPDWNSIQGYGPDLADGTDALGVGRDGLEGLRAEVLAHPGSPWFLHVHVKEPHYPYDPPVSYRAEEEALPPIAFDLTTVEGMSEMNRAYTSLSPDEQALVQLHVEALYTAELRWLDDQLAELWAEMEAGGWLDDTLVVVWSDHGEAMYDHRKWRHGYQLYREENDGLLAFWAKNLEPLMWDGPTHAIDVVPTALAVLGVPADGALPGAIVGTAAADRPRFTSTSGFSGPMAAVTVGDDKLVYRFSGTLERYDEAADPGERTNLSTPADPTSLALWALLEPRVRLLDDLVPEEAVPPTP